MGARRFQTSGERSPSPAPNVPFDLRLKPIDHPASHFLGHAGFKRRVNGLFIFSIFVKNAPMHFFVTMYYLCTHFKIIIFVKIFPTLRSVTMRDSFPTLQHCNFVGGGTKNGTM